MINPRAIPPDYREIFEKELLALNSILQKLQNEMELLQSNSLTNEDELGYGSRVELSNIQGHKILGRVISFDKINGNYYIDRDGYNSLIKKKKNELNHLSIGYIGRLEKQIWILEQKKTELENILNNSEIDSNLLENQTNIIEIVGILQEHPCEILEYVLAKNLNSGRLKVPKNYIKELGFYEINVSDSKIITLKKSSRIAFEMSMKRQ